jgi:hypothetical protein
MEKRQIDEEVAELERLQRRPPSGGGGGSAIGLNDYFSVDGKEGVPAGVLFTPGKYALQVIDLNMKLSKGGIDDKTQQAKEQIPYLELTFKVIACDDPEFIDQTITDRLMAKGKGVTRFKVFAKAVGLWDDEKDQFTGRPLDFMEAFVWATVKTEKSNYKGNDQERSIIDFAGYEPISKYPLPDDSYFGAPDGEPDAPAAVVEDDEPEDLETLPVDEETEGEDDLEPLDDPEPVAAKPAARPRAAAAAGQSGGKPPWK